MLLTLEEALLDRERQDSEFKTSRAETTAAAQALVGFANSRGGQVFFGVTDEGEAKGIQFGRTTIEDLTTKLDMLIYPSLPLEFEHFPGQNDKRVVRVWTPADKPPIIGSYLYSKDSLSLDDRVELARSQTYRRVGRQTRKVDFMWLRGVLPSDPLLIIDAGDGSQMSQVQSDHIILNWDAWHVSGGVALELNVTTDPSLGSVSGPMKELPGKLGSMTHGTLGLSLPALRAAIDLDEVPGGQAGQF